jgi:hypothetical protein
VGIALLAELISLAADISGFSGTPQDGSAIVQPPSSREGHALDRCGSSVVLLQTFEGLACD